MIVVITTRGHDYTLKSIVQGAFGFPVPHVTLSDYDAMFRARRVPRATYIFSDLERLAPWELKIAADLFQTLKGAGLRCLNDPARAMSRVELLRALHAAGINPFNIMRADEQPRPARFPVFLRFEADHANPLSGLLGSQDELEATLKSQRDSGVPLRGVVVIEHCAEPYRPGLWHKWGTFRVGRQMSVDHIAVDDNWLVKYGVWEKLTDEAIEDEHDAVTTNRFAAELESVFDLAGIEFGRADHATVNGRTVVYEINTNPTLGPYVPDPKPLRRATQTLARQRFAQALKAIDTASTGTISVPAVGRRKRDSWWKFRFLGQTRP